MAEQVPWWHLTPTSTSNPFSSMGVDWCPRCKMEVQADMFSVHQGETFTYKKVCLRCGKVICHGMWDHVKCFTHRPLPAAAFEWIFEAGKDRR